MKDDKTDPDHEGEDAVTEGEAAVSGDAATLGEAQEETDGGSAEHSAERDLEAELADSAGCGAARSGRCREYAAPVRARNRESQKVCLGAILRRPAQCG
jgi:hypothetical protein